METEPTCCILDVKLPDDVGLLEFSFTDWEYPTVVQYKNNQNNKKKKTLHGTGISLGRIDLFYSRYIADNISRYSI